MAENADFYEDWRKRLNEPMTFGETLDALRRFHIDSDMRHERDMAESRARMERIEASQAQSETRMNKLEASQVKTEATLRRAIRLAVEDGLRQRKRNAEFDRRNTEFDKRQAELQELLKAFLKRGGNGNP